MYSRSCDAGERWTIVNAVGNPIRAWDSRDHVIRSVYDELHRRTELWVKHGEGQTDPEDANLRGKLYEVKDGAGVVTSVSYDFKGNLLVSQRQLAEAYSTQLDWSDTVTLEAETFAQTTVYDALNRPTTITTPDASEIKPTYNEAGLLEKVEARIRDAETWTTFVDDIDYDAKGQRERIVYGNGVYTEYSYDPLTYRVKRIKTTRTSDSEVLQDLRYTYDAVGNIVEMADVALDTVYYDDDVMVPVWKYEYDALYRLINATGREHAGTSSDIQQDAYGFPLVSGANPNDPSAMRNYEESYEYDQVGNILKMIHDANSSVGDWTRYYHIAEMSNRLLDTSLPGDDEEDAVYSAEYTHDAHGNMLTMPHLDGVDWDFKDQMRHVDKGGGGEVYFTYDASGQRVRKVWEHSGIVEERIYLVGFELYRRHELGDVVLERETLHIMDDTRRIAMVETKTIDTAADPFTVTPRIRYQCSNHLGSAMLELDDEGLVISYEEYHPYGTSAYRAVDDTIEVSARRYRYTGKERDEETGLYYHGARYYACWLGRWTSADPAGMVDGANLYQYVRGRPVGLSDPTGTEAQKETARSSTHSPPPAAEVKKIQDLIERSHNLAKEADKLKEEAGRLEAEADKMANSANRLQLEASTTEDDTTRFKLFLKSSEQLDQATEGRRIATTLTKKADELYEELGTQRTAIIDLTIRVFHIDRSAAKSIEYEHKHATTHNAHATTDEREIKIGATLFTTAGRLASVISHEAEVHAKQQKLGIVHAGTSPTAAKLAEIVAYDWQIGNAKRFGLTNSEIEEVRKRRREYYDELPPSYKKRVDKGIMTEF